MGKNAVFHGAAKQFDKILFLNHQMNPIVTPVSILTETQFLANLSVKREEIPFDPRLIGSIPCEGSDRALLYGHHFGLSHGYSQ
ncbi:MAG TPA: hypothetical protein VGD60_09110 [Candidatus Acidoferrales bacterium]